MPAEANNLPDSEAVPSSLPEVSPILRVAHKIHPTHPRIAYLCEFCNKYHNHDNFLIFIKSRDNRLLLLSGVLAALEESLIVCSLNCPIDVFKFKNSLWYWTKTICKPNQQNLFHFQFVYLALFVMLRSLLCRMMKHTGMEKWGLVMHVICRISISSITRKTSKLCSSFLKTTDILKVRT